MRSIFYDLETTSTLPIGQILNFSFIVVDQNFEIIDEFSDYIQISPLQLPEPGAMLANRTDVLKHQQSAMLSEKDAMLRIGKFLESHIEAAREKGEGEKVPFVGYNSSQFDLPFLRTSFIRNGLNPYFRGLLVNRDLLFVTRKLAATHPDFPRFASLRPEEGRAQRLSLTLENLCTRLGILTEAQTHFSRDDVIIEIALAQMCAERFGLDVRNYEPYEARKFHAKLRSGEVVYAQGPNYDLALPERSEQMPMTLLDADYRSSLWVDLQAYAKGEGRKSVRWYNVAAKSFFLAEDQHVPLPEHSTLAQEALHEFKDVGLGNFFSRSVCDIEMDIYRLDMSGIDALYRDMWLDDRRDLERLKSKDAKVLSIRHKLANYCWGGSGDERANALLRDYARYRYAGECIISKTATEENEAQRHPTLAEMRQSLLDLRRTAEPNAAQLLDSLETFYQESRLGTFLLSGPS